MRLQRCCLDEKREKEVFTKVASLMGYYELRPKHEQVIRPFVRGNDEFVSLPTGSGKSLWYSLFSTLFRRQQRPTKATHHRQFRSYHALSAVQYNWNCIHSLWHSSVSRKP